MFPEHKFLIVEALRQQGFACGMTGDGVNDAPALKKADIGIAVQGATDAARAAADIVLTSPGLSVVIDAITISRCIFQRIQNFVLYRVACTLQLLVFFFIAVLAFHPDNYARKGASNVIVGSAADGWSGQNQDGLNVAWHSRACPVTNIFSATGVNHSTAVGVPPPPAPDNWVGKVWMNGNVECVWVPNSNSSWATWNTYGEPIQGYPPLGWAQPGWLCSGPICVERWRKYFNLPVIALIIITVLNDGTIISIAYDHVEPSKFPEKWNLPVSYLISGVLGGIACASSILLLHLVLDSHNEAGTWVKGWGLPPLTYGNVVAALYLKVSLSDFLTLFSARTRQWFFSIPPAKPLLAAAVVALGCSTTLASLWPFNESKDTKMDGFARGAKWDKRANVIGAVWLYVFIWWFVQDAAKYLFYIVLFKTGLLHRRTAMFSAAEGAPPPMPSAEAEASKKEEKIVTEVKA